jgi:hypothetical protein
MVSTYISFENYVLVASWMVYPCESLIEAPPVPTLRGSLHHPSTHCLPGTPT